MRSKVGVLFITAFMLIAGINAVFAQQGEGEISGYVFYDANGDGICPDGNDFGRAGIPVQVLNRGTNSTINLLTAEDGEYIADGLVDGTWQVTVNPGADWRVTSQQTVQVELTDVENFVEGIDFCIVEVSFSGDDNQQGNTPTPTLPPTVTPVATPGSTAPGSGQQVLPESGAPLAPGLLGALALGVTSIIGGVLLFLSGRRNRR